VFQYVENVEALQLAEMYRQLLPTACRASFVDSGASCLQHCKHGLMARRCVEAQSLRGDRGGLGQKIFNWLLGFLAVS